MKGNEEKIFKKECIMSKKHFQKSHEVGKARGQQPGRCLLERKLKEEKRSDSKNKQRKKERKI